MVPTPGWAVALYVEDMEADTPKRTLRGKALTGLATLTLGALVLTGCGTPGYDDEPTTTETTRTTTATAPAGPTPGATGTPGGEPGGEQDGNETDGTTPPTPLAPLGTPDTNAKIQRSEGERRLIVTGVRVATHDTFDRVVFDLEGEGTPGWWIDYDDAPGQQGSGFPIQHGGVTALNVHIEGTPYPFDLDRDPVDLGTVPGAGGVVSDVTSAGIFEARSQFAVGTSGRLPYSVTALENPTRVVIDVLHE